MSVLTILFLSALIATIVVLFFYTAPQIGESAKGERLNRIQQSKNYDKGKFQNLIPTPMDMSLNDIWETSYEMIKGADNRAPIDTIQTSVFNRQRFENASDTELIVHWFGHSTALFKINGLNVLADPVFSDRASMFSFMGPKKYPYSHQMDVSQLPKIDYLLISHDHYDHLDYETIRALKGKVDHYYVPLGVGAHLERWGIDSARITELDWWESVKTANGLELVFTPSRHFSGRAFSDRFKSLWGSWVILGKEKRVFFGGDSGYFDGFKEIGDKYGPFDLTLLECGQYNKRWPDIHMTPEETVKAHIDLKGKILVPIHWGKFTLALHPWKESAQRAWKESQRLNVDYLTPIIGEQIKVYSHIPYSDWWVEAK